MRSIISAPALAVVVLVAAASMSLAPARHAAAHIQTGDRHAHAVAAAITTPHEQIPDFDRNPTIVSAASGPWSAAGTWSPARLPGAGDVVSIAPGTTVTVDSLAAAAGVVGVQANGTLAFRRDLDTRLTVGTLLVREGGAPENGGRSVVKDLRIWHHASYAFYGYPTHGLTFDGVVIRGDPTVLSNWHEFVLGIYFGDYMTKDAIITNANIQGVRTGVDAPIFSRGQTLVENSFLRNTVNVSVRTIGAPGSAPYGPNMPEKHTIIRNTLTRTLPGSQGGHQQYAIALGYTTHNGSANLVKLDDVHVYDHNRVSGDNFRVYYPEQRPDFVVPRTSGNLAGSPEAGLTNAQNWTKHSLAIAGAVAPCATTRPDVEGFVCPLAPPSRPSTAPGRRPATAPTVVPAPVPPPGDRQGSPAGPGTVGVPVRR